MSQADNGGTSTRWEGYSDYQIVSKRVGKSVHNAIEAYARLDSLHAEGAQVPPETAATARSHIFAAALKLVPELRRDAPRENDDDNGGVELYGEILDRWEGDDGYLRNKLHNVQLQRECPGWLFQFILDIRRAAWELGYLQAGRERKGEPDDPVEAETADMFTE